MKRNVRSCVDIKITIQLLVSHFANAFANDDINSKHSTFFLYNMGRCCAADVCACLRHNTKSLLGN